MEHRELFNLLFYSSNEEEVEKVINSNPEVFKQGNWFPYGDNESYFGVIENQQASPIPALIEKITNAIDAILTRKCYEAGIDPKAPDAPKSMEEAIQKFFPEYKQWDLTSFRKAQSEPSEGSNENKWIYGIPDPSNKNGYLYSDYPGNLFEKFKNSFYKTPPEETIK